MGDTQGSAALLATERDETIAEARQLIQHLRDAARDGGSLARRYDDVMVKGIDEHCTEFELGAVPALVRLEAAR